MVEKAPRKRIKVMYGWNTLTAIAPNVWKYRFSNEECKIKEIEVNEHTGQITGPTVPLGKWFEHFAQAKAAAKREWEGRLLIATEAIKEIRATKSSNVRTM